MAYYTNLITDPMFPLVNEVLSNKRGSSIAQTLKYKLALPSTLDQLHYHPNYKPHHFNDTLLTQFEIFICLNLKRFGIRENVANDLYPQLSDPAQIAALATRMVSTGFLFKNNGLDNTAINTAATQSVGMFIPEASVPPLSAPVSVQVSRASSPTRSRAGSVSYPSPFDTAELVEKLKQVSSASSSTILPKAPSETATVNLSAKTNINSSQTTATSFVTAIPLTDKSFPDAPMDTPVTFPTAPSNNPTTTTTTTSIPMLVVEGGIFAPTKKANAPKEPEVIKAILPYHLQFELINEGLRFTQAANLLTQDPAKARLELMESQKRMTELLANLEVVQNEDNQNSLQK